MQLVLLVVKFLLLGIIYLFIFRVFYLIIRDLRKISETSSGQRPIRRDSSGAELVVTESSDPGLRQGDAVYLGTEIRIGRGPQNDVRMADAFVSHDHTRIIFRQGQYFLEDLGSVNGTYINGVRVSDPTPLNHGDTIRIAGAIFKFVRWEYEVEQDISCGPGQKKQRG